MIGGKRFGLRIVIRMLGPGFPVFPFFAVQTTRGDAERVHQHHVSSGKKFEDKRVFVEFDFHDPIVTVLGNRRDFFSFDAAAEKFHESFVFVDRGDFVA